MGTTGTGEPYTPNQPRIADRCPSCGGQTLFIGAGGWLTCSVIGCKAPGAASDWLRDADATRAKLAECEQKAESYDLTHTGDWFERAHALGQRDPAKYAGRDIWHVAVEMAERLAEVERARDEARERADQWANAIATQRVPLDMARALAASQAEGARLREALEERGEHGRKCPWAYFSAGRPKDGGGYEMLYREAWYEVRPDDKRPACTCGLNAALASAPGSTDALREVCERVGEKAWVAGVEAYKAPPPEGITDRDGFNDYVLSSIKSIVSRILGERGKEGGDA